MTDQTPMKPPRYVPIDAQLLADLKLFMKRMHYHLTIVTQSASDDCLTEMREIRKRLGATND